MSFSGTRDYYPRDRPARRHFAQRGPDWRLRGTRDFEIGERYEPRVRMERPGAKAGRMERVFYRNQRREGNYADDGNYTPYSESSSSDSWPRYPGLNRSRMSTRAPRRAYPEEEYANSFNDVDIRQKRSRPGRYSPNRFKVGEAVYFTYGPRNRQTWVPAEVLEVVEDGYGECSYKVLLLDSKQMMKDVSAYDLRSRRIKTKNDIAQHRQNPILYDIPEKRKFRAGGPRRDEYSYALQRARVKNQRSKPSHRANSLGRQGDIFDVNSRVNPRTKASRRAYSVGRQIDLLDMTRARPTKRRRSNSPSKLPCPMLFTSQRKDQPRIPDSPLSDQDGMDEGKNPKVMACYLCFALAFQIFYVAALSENSDVGEINCGKGMWYSSILITVLGWICPLIVCYYYNEPLRYVWEYSTMAICIVCLWSVSAVVNFSILLDQVLRISPGCKEQVEEFKLFWDAAQIQAYGFLTFMIITCVCIICCCFPLGWCFSYLPADPNDTPAVL